MIDRGELQKLHDLILAARNELHRLDGSAQTDYASFNSPAFDEAASLLHRAYSSVVSFVEKKKAA